MPDQAARSPEQEYRFGPFRLLPARHALFEGDRPVRLGSRALEILIALVERPADTVGKDDLMRRVWPDTFVEEANLRVHVAALRRALGDGHEGMRFLANVPGRGYRFVAEVTRLEAASAAVPPAPAPVEHSLPAPLGRIVGRDEAVAGLVAAVEKRRLISIVGPGGIGKTTVAVAVADRLAPSFGGSVCFVDLSPIADPALIPGALGSAFGLAVGTANPLPSLVSYLAGRRALVVLDSCEPAVEAVAVMIETVLRGAPGVRILATSREPLRAEGEHVQRLAPLTFPEPGALPSAAEALQHSAVQLFVERAAASLDGFELGDAEAPVVADICRRLDGIALAIELAAGRVDAFGIKGIAGLLDDRFRLLARGRRTALPRHQTLTATLDWSYAALDAVEQKALRALAIFPGTFDLEAASAVLAGDPGSALDSLADLVAKSLIAADVSSPIVRYRMGESTRAYALGKLAEHAELADTARKHAIFVLRALRDAATAMNSPGSEETFALFRFRVHCIRAAFEWAFSPRGDVSMAPPLVAAAVPLWMHLSLVEELVTWTERALAVAWDTGHVGGTDEMQLQAAFGLALMFTKGSMTTTQDALRRSLEIADGHGNIEYALRALWGLWVGRLNNGSIRESLELARDFAGRAAASSDPLDAAIGDRMIGFSLHFLGEQAESRIAIERMLGRDGATHRTSHPVRFQFDQWTTARAALAEVLWLQGFSDQALAAAERSVAEASITGHALTYCNTLAKSAAVVLLAGDLEAAQRMIEALLEQASAHALSFWKAEGGCLAGILQMRSGEHEEGLARLRQELHGFPGSTLTVRYIAFLGELAEALSISGDVAAARATIAQALERCTRNEERWCASELLRIHGDIVLRAGGPAADAEELFAESLEWARAQGALAWELRTAMSLARLRRSQGGAAEGNEQLAAVLARFTEGFDSVDLRAARRMLDEGAAA